MFISTFHHHSNIKLCGLLFIFKIFNKSNFLMFILIIGTIPTRKWKCSIYNTYLFVKMTFTLTMLRKKVHTIIPPSTKVLHPPDESWNIFRTWVYVNKLIMVYYIQCHPKQTDTFQPYAHMNIDYFMSQYL